mmetsp:Transcript_22128/g.54726  ORF Transcript_22128/g.54726 Transcript_22128/m.54726 type:complete len:615 (+) Transcript_22128:113-1957(+)|eukprot:CAMPEP_0113639446 /NCGR_PEP_ID=MMETSP0017_2-20120614/20690_1 /TAXON_ID=2856 /ORGANISM="Cylindrotheca closterium" /LENGTH=614 /DNA_ID=CAMNT_0000550653 /DNA_START=82 /DNA_END=1926 /DNA_ORIENTATION=+ /assembly_acc=CAM_ASM_000147
MPPSPTAVDSPPEAALVEPLLPPSTATTTEEAAIVSLIPEDESPFVGTLEQQPSTQQQIREPELLVVSLDDSAWEHGEDQDLKFQNPCFAFIFLAQAITLLVFGIHAIKTFVTYQDRDDDGDNDPQDDDNGSDDIDIHVVLYYARHFLFAFLATVTSIIMLSASVLSYLLRQTGATRRMIEISLIFAPVSYAMSAIGCMAVGLIPMAGIFLLSALLGTCYVCTVWKRIPVAAANLAVAMTAVKAHQGSLIGLGYTLTFVAASWTCMWVLAIGDIGFRDSSFFWQCQAPSSSNQQHDDPNCSLTSGGVCVGLLLLLSLFWTLQVIKNLCHTTVAGVVGSWWFSTPSGHDEEVANGDSLIQESSTPSPKKVVYDSWIRSSVYSFGSICFGSLVVGLLQVLQLILRCGREQNRRDRNSSSGLVLCICQCIVNQLERLAEYMNKWAFVYVGLYGYDYWTAGSKVFNLFKARGWSVILNDHLITRYLTLLQALLSLLSAVICQFWGWLFVIRPLSASLRQAAENDPANSNNNNDPADMSVLWYSFFSIGFVLGMSLSSVLFRLISSAVDTIVVCFAEAPNQLSVLGRQVGPRQRPILKPSLANEMILAWRQVYPQECGF